MIEMKKIFIGLFVFIFIHIEQVSSKSLPPGTGAGDVPANILIMLDKSGSMGWRMSGGTASMRYPYDADADSNGDIIVSHNENHTLFDKRANIDLSKIGRVFESSTL